MYIHGSIVKLIVKLNPYTVLNVYPKQISKKYIIV